LIELNPTPSLGKKTLLARMLRLGIFGQLIMVALLFGPAHSFNFWQAWAFMGLGLAATTWTCIYFYKRDPQLLERRMLRREKLIAQKLVMGLWRTLSVASFLLVGYDHRVGWSASHLAPVPLWLELLSLVGIAAAYLLFFQVMKANSFAASVIQVEAGQTVITTGPYRNVRHPMYLAFALMTLLTPLALGSFLAAPVALLILLTLLLRLFHEESVLRRDLPGYTEYCRRTPYRLIPFVF
jgi:protein-S-isoprenylcysteine O-methyltransferase Ste14